MGRPRKEFIPKSNFDIEWHDYQISHGYKSAVAMIKDLPRIDSRFQDLPASDVSRYRNMNFRTKKQCMPDRLAEAFADLFGVRKEYLLEKDNYRTNAVHKYMQARNLDIFRAIHLLLFNLGYADLDTDLNSQETNITMSPNTREFLRSKQAQATPDTRLICDINADKYIEVTNDKYTSLVINIANYALSLVNEMIKSDLSKPVPQTYIDGVMQLMQHTQIDLKDGGKISCDLNFQPLLEYSGDLPTDHININITDS